MQSIAHQRCSRQLVASASRLISPRRRALVRPRARHATSVSFAARPLTTCIVANRSVVAITPAASTDPPCILQRQRQHRAFSSFNNDEEVEHYEEDFEDEHSTGDDEYAADDEHDDYDADGTYLHLPQSDHPRIDFASDPTLNKLDAIDTTKRILSSVPVGCLHPSDVLHGLTPLLKDCCLVQTDAGMRTAQSLLERMMREKKEINAALIRELKDKVAEQGVLCDASEVAPPLVVAALPFHILMHGWARMSGRGVHRDGPNKIAELIEWMGREDQYDAQIRGDFDALVQADDDGEDDQQQRRRRNLPSCQPTTASYNTLLTAYTYASKQDRLAGKKAERVLRTMSKRNREDGWHCKPTTRSFGLAISAHAKSDRYKSAIFAQYVLNDMKVMHEAERERYEAEVGTPYDVADPDSNAWRIVTPDNIAYTTVISAFASADAKGYARKAEDVLFEMIDSSGKYGIRIDSPAFDACIRGWSAAAKRMGNPKARFEAAERAEAMLKLMEEMAAEYQSIDDNKDNPLIPTTRTYNAVLSAWARSDIKEAAPRAEALLYKMLATVIPPGAAADDDNTPTNSSSIAVPPPDRISFNTVISAHARSFSPGAAERGEELFDMMYELYHSGRMGEEIKPRADTYSTVINAWARSRDREGQTASARRLLDVMIEKFRGGEEDMAPNILSYTSVLNAAVNEAMKEETVGADENDEKSGDDDDESFDDDSAYSIAMRTYQQMKTDAHDCGVQPDHITYATMMKVVGGNTAKESSERESMLETIFEDACASGRVSSHVIKELRLAAPDVGLLERLLRSRELATSEKSIFHELPKRWTRNVNADQRVRGHRVNMKDMIKKEVKASASAN